MAASPSPAAPDEIRLSTAKTRRDLRLSLALLVAGVVITVVFYGFVVWATSTGASDFSPWSFFLISGIANAGSVLILVGAIFAAINWWLLRKRDGAG